MSRIRIPFPVKVGVSILLLLVVLLKVDVPSVSHAFASIGLTYCILAITVAVIFWLVNTHKWQVLLGRSEVSVRFGELLRLNFIGIFYNMVLPGQISGEVVKGVKLAHLGVGGARSAVSVITDRTTSLFAIFVIGIIGLAFSPSAGGSGDYLLWLVGFALLLGFAIVVLLAGGGSGPVGKLLSPAGRVLQRFNLNDWQLSLGSQRWPLILYSIFLALIFQFGVVLTNYLFALALNIPISYMQLLWVVAIASLLQSLPISIAGIGVREGAYIYLLSLQGVAEPAALALSVLIFGTQILFAVAGGSLQLQEVWATRHKSVLPG